MTVELLSVLCDPGVMLGILITAIALANIAMILYVWWKVK